MKNEPFADTLNDTSEREQTHSRWIAIFENHILENFGTKIVSSKVMGDHTVCVEYKNDDRDRVIFGWVNNVGRVVVENFVEIV